MSSQHFSRLLIDNAVVHATQSNGDWYELELAPWLPGGKTLAPGEAKLGAVVFAVPVEPSKIVGIGKNYRAHAAEMGGPLPEEPLLFLKAPSTLTAHGSEIQLPSLSKRVDFEGELAVVIGTRARAVSVETALDYVFGYTAACDLTVRDLQAKDGQWARAKSFDGFCPLGPVISRDVDVSRSQLTTFVNGVLRQSANISDMVFNVAQIVSHVSQAMTLLPGDVILTGTPEGVGPLQPGDKVAVCIQGLSTLEFRVGPAVGA